MPGASAALVVVYIGVYNRRMAVRNTTATREVLSAFAKGADLYGMDIIRLTGLASGTVYPILRRLEAEGWLNSRWEGIDPAGVGRPERRLYEITAQGDAARRRFNREVENRRLRAGRQWQVPFPEIGGQIN
jgi:DNA-binding PadR family transcriptional regulator